MVIGTRCILSFGSVYIFKVALFGNFWLALSFAHVFCLVCGLDLWVGKLLNLVADLNGALNQLIFKSK